MKMISMAFFCLLVINGISQQTTPLNCTATCIMPDLYQTEILTVHLYTGNAENAPHTERRVIELSPNRKTWKKVPDPDCPSGLAEDCYLWQEVEQKGENIEVTVVTNTTKQKDYVTQQISRERLVKSGGYNLERSIVCPEDITPSLMHNVSMRLTDTGYYSGLIYSVFNSKIKAALKRYQTHNGLPVGHLNAETLEALGLSVPN